MFKSYGVNTQSINHEEILNISEGVCYKRETWNAAVVSRWRANPKVLIPQDRWYWPSSLLRSARTANNHESQRNAPEVIQVLYLIVSFCRHLTIRWIALMRLEKNRLFEEYFFRSLWIRNPFQYKDVMLLLILNWRNDSLAIVFTSQSQLPNQ